MNALRDGQRLRSATALAALIREGKLTPSAVVEACLSSIEATQSTLNAFVTVARDAARRDAAAADRASAALPLRGVPFSVKDNIETAGVRTTYGSKTLADNITGVDAIAVQRLRAAGAIMVGKTTLPEFASSLLGTSPLTGITRNPWNLDCSPAGSSSGAAAAVAAGLGPIALTTDAGASTRVPAGVCGVLGLKPSIGLIPYEQFPDGFGNFIHMGLMARTVADLATVLDVVSGEDPNDPLSIGVAPTRASEALAKPFPLTGQRIAWRAFMGNTALDDEVRALCEATLDKLKAAGASILSINEPYESAAPTWRVLQQANWAGRFKIPDEATAKLMDAGFVGGIKAGASASAAELSAAIYKRTHYFRLVQSWFAQFEWLATPVTTVAAVPADARGDSVLTINGKPAGELRVAWAPYHNVFNLTGHPALSVPVGFTGAGMPVGMQIVGRLYADAQLLRLAKAIEGAQPWADRIPGAAPA
jgi:aspartyl-tRNA(Asn)/glutamyl-tRNA(Gln) amidotransferase subunit A